MNATTRRMIHFPTFTADSTWLDRLLARLPEARVGVFGDLCLDAYWMLNGTPSETSLETGLIAHHVREQRYSPGGGGNVAVNVATLGAGRVELVGLIGSDMMGDELLRQFDRRGVVTDNVLRGHSGWQTLVYAKPCRGSTELNRFDFGLGQALPSRLISELLVRASRIAETCPVVVVNQQVPGGWPAELVSGISTLVRSHPDTLFMVDSRDHADQFSGAVLKLNMSEAARLLGENYAALIPESAQSLAFELERRQRCPVVITRGEHGLVLAVKGELYDIPGIELPGAIDAVGAGDTAVAALAAAFAVRANPLEAGALANLAAAFTTRQLHTTGVATPADLRAIGPAPDYVFAPRLATQPHLASHLPNSTIEIVSGRHPSKRIRHAIFDHDGPISVLRQGWEKIMEPMMIEAIIGQHATLVSDETRARIVSTVRALIDRTTGIQTLAQMKELVGLVHEFGLVDPADVNDEHGYKAIFNKSLLAVVHRRVADVERGILSVEDWQIKHVRTMIERLHGAGVTLYLASGTDHADAVTEARLLGYADFFCGGIFGSVGDLRIEAKRDLLQRIIRACEASADEILVVGDGPVEIREGRRYGAYTIGVASDEVRRHGCDQRKRTRLIRAGADIIVPDFCEVDTLLVHLGLA